MVSTICCSSDCVMLYFLMDTEDGKRFFSSADLSTAFLRSAMPFSPSNQVLKYRRRSSVDWKMRGIVSYSHRKKKVIRF